MLKYLIGKKLTMPRNKVQFQKGQNLADFLADCGTVAQGEQAAFQAHRPRSFRHPYCGCRKSCQLRHCKSWQYTRCQRGRGAAGKGAFVAAVRVSADEHLEQLRLNPLAGFRQRELQAWTARHAGAPGRAGLLALAAIAGQSGIRKFG